MILILQNKSNTPGVLHLILKVILPQTSFSLLTYGYKKTPQKMRS